MLILKDFSHFLEQGYNLKCLDENNLFIILHYSADLIYDTKIYHSNITTNYC